MRVLKKELRFISYKRKRKKQNPKLVWVEAVDIKRRIEYLIKRVGLGFEGARIFGKRSTGAKTRAVARIWGLSKLWQETLGQKPAYIIEVVSERFDRLSQKQKDEILLHELAHIPKNFSGALAPHKKGKGHFHDKLKGMLIAYRTSRQ